MAFAQTSVREKIEQVEYLTGLLERVKRVQQVADALNTELERLACVIDGIDSPEYESKDVYVKRDLMKSAKKLFQYRFMQAINVNVIAKDLNEELRKHEAELSDLGVEVDYLEGVRFTLGIESEEIEEAPEEISEESSEEETTEEHSEETSEEETTEEHSEDTSEEMSEETSEETSEEESSEEMSEETSEETTEEEISEEETTEETPRPENEKTEEKAQRAEAVSCAKMVANVLSAQLPRTRGGSFPLVDNIFADLVPSFTPSRTARGDGSSSPGVQ